MSALIVSLLILICDMLSLGIFSMKMKIEFLEEKIKWQEKMIGEIENEGRDVGPCNNMIHAVCAVFITYTSDF